MQKETKTVIKKDQEDDDEASEDETLFVEVANEETRDYILNLLCGCCQVRCPYVLAHRNRCAECYAENLCEKCYYLCGKCVNEERDYAVYCVTCKGRCGHKSAIEI
jgi:hypothetical protein